MKKLGFPESSFHSGYAMGWRWEEEKGRLHRMSHCALTTAGKGENRGRVTEIRSPSCKQSTLHILSCFSPIY